MADWNFSNIPALPGSWNEDKETWDEHDETAPRFYRPSTPQPDDESTSSSVPTSPPLENSQRSFDVISEEHRPQREDGDGYEADDGTVDSDTADSTATLTQNPAPTSPPQNTGTPLALLDTILRESGINLDTPEGMEELVRRIGVTSGSVASPSPVRAPEVNRQSRRRAPSSPTPLSRIKSETESSDVERTKNGFVARAWLRGLPQSFTSQPNPAYPDLSIANISSAGGNTLRQNTLDETGEVTMRSLYPEATRSTFTSLQATITKIENTVAAMSGSNNPTRYKPTFREHPLPPNNPLHCTLGITHIQLDPSNTTTLSPIIYKIPTIHLTTVSIRYRTHWAKNRHQNKAPYFTLDIDEATMEVFLLWVYEARNYDLHGYATDRLLNLIIIALIMQIPKLYNDSVRVLVAYHERAQPLIPSDKPPSRLPRPAAEGNKFNPSQDIMKRLMYMTRRDAPVRTLVGWLFSVSGEMTYGYVEPWEFGITRAIEEVLQTGRKKREARKGGSTVEWEDILVEEKAGDGNWKGDGWMGYTDDENAT